MYAAGKEPVELERSKIKGRGSTSRSLMPEAGGGDRARSGRQEEGHFCGYSHNGGGDDGGEGVEKLWALHLTASLSWCSRGQAVC